MRLGVGQLQLNLLHWKLILGTWQSQMNPKTARELLWAKRFSVGMTLFMLFVTLGCLGLCVLCAFTGEIGIGSKFGNSVLVYRAQSPILFWFIWVIWLSLAWMLSLFTIVMIRETKELLSSGTDKRA